MPSKIIKIIGRGFSWLGTIISSFFSHVDTIGGQIGPWIVVSVFWIVGLAFFVGPVVIVSRTSSGDIIWAAIIVQWIFGSVVLLAGTFVFATGTDLGNRFLVPVTTKLWHSILREPLSTAFTDTPWLRLKPRLVIRRGVNHLGILSIYLMGLPVFLGGLICLEMAVSNLTLGSALAALLILPASVLLLFWRENFVLDRRRRKVIARKSLLFLFRKDKEYDWNQCTAVCVGGLLHYQNTPWGRVAPEIVTYHTDNPPNPHPNVEPMTFDVGIVCGNELISIAEFGLGWAAERLGRKVAAYMDLPIKDPHDEGFDLDLRPK
ncbi:MAG: hypothetical protein V3T61_05720 [Acidobacteriota bacterium]